MFQFNLSTLIYQNNVTAFILRKTDRTPLDGCEAMRIVTEICPRLTYPERIRSRKIRKYLATTCQVNVLQQNIFQNVIMNEVCYWINVVYVISLCLSGLLTIDRYLVVYNLLLLQFLQLVVFTVFWLQTCYFIIYAIKTK